jgi:hypothetical protein
MAQKVSRWSLTAEARIQSQASLCEICGERSGSGTGFSEFFAFPRPYHSTGRPLQLLIYN